MDIAESVIAVLFGLLILACVWLFTDVLGIIWIFPVIIAVLMILWPIYSAVENVGFVKKHKSNVEVLLIVIAGVIAILICSLFF